MVFPEFTEPFAEVPLEPAEPQYSDDPEETGDAVWVGEYEDPAEWNDVVDEDEGWLEDEYVDGY